MSSVLSVRLGEQERVLLEAASSQARTNVSDFVRRKTLEAAELDMMERRVVSIPSTTNCARPIGDGDFRIFRSTPKAR